MATSNSSTPSQAELDKILASAILKTPMVTDTYKPLAQPLILSPEMAADIQRLTDSVSPTASPAAPVAAAVSVAPLAAVAPADAVTVTAASVSVAPLATAFSTFGLPKAAATKIVLDALAGDGVINAAEANKTTTLVTGRVQGSYTNWDEVSVTVNNVTSKGYVLNGKFSVEVKTADLLAAKSSAAGQNVKVELVAHDASGQPTTVTTTQSYLIDTVGPTNSGMVVDAITGDDLVARDQSGSLINVTGKVTGEFSAGDQVTLKVNNVIYQGNVAQNGTFNILVKGSDLIADADKVLDASVITHDAAGNPSTSNFAITHPYGVTNAPSAVFVTSNPVTADNVLNLTESKAVQTLSGKVTGIFTAGDSISVKVGNVVATTTVSANGTYSVKMNGADLAKSNLVQTTLEAHGSNNNVTTVTDTRSYKVDLVGPNNNSTKITFDNITSDNYVTLAESSQKHTITGKVTGDFKAGDVINVWVSGVSVSTTVAADGKFSVVEKGLDLYNSRSITAVLTAHDAAGNVGTVVGTRGYGSAKPVPPPPPRNGDPLVLDLNGDGVQTSALDGTVKFDIAATGVKQATGWVSKQDGLLAIDLNANGKIDSGAELFGNAFKLASGQLAKDGWEALTQYDTNKDGVINSKDAVFSQLRVWVDANSNGVTDSGELKTLAQAKVASISLQNDDAQVAQNGNVLSDFGSYTNTDGKEQSMADAWFQTDPAATVATDVTMASIKNGTTSLNGGAGIYTLKLDVSSAVIDFTTVQALTNIHNFNAIDMTGSGNNTIHLNLESVTAMSNHMNALSQVSDYSVMVVNGNAGDNLQLDGSWTAGTAVLNAVDLMKTHGNAYQFNLNDTYTSYTNGLATLLVDTQVNTVLG